MCSMCNSQNPNIVKTSDLTSSTSSVKKRTDSEIEESLNDLKMESSLQTKQEGEEVQNTNVE